MSNEERQRTIREAGSKPAEAEKQESAKAAKQAEGKEKAEEKAAAKKARGKSEPQPVDEEAGRPKVPRRRRRKKDESAERGAPSAEADAEEAKQEAAEEEAESEQAEVRGEPEPEEETAEPKKAARRRGAAEVSSQRRTKPAPRRDGDGAVLVRAKAKYVRTAPRKARLVVDHIRGKGVDEARAILRNTPRAASRDVLKLLDSAIANAENNHELVADELRIAHVYVDEGPTLKRYRPRALGRATRIRKRTSHMTIELTPKE